MFSRIKKRAKPQKNCAPEGVVKNGGNPTYSCDSIGGVEAGVRHVNTFDVAPKHEVLPAGNGVKFNVETVPSALKIHLEKKTISRGEFIDGLLESLRNQELSTADPWAPYQPGNQPPPKVMEALSETTDNIVHTGSDGLAMALVTAFAQHLPLQLSPDAIWIAINYAFAKHVDQNAETLRKNFVQHEGKKRLLVTTPDSFAMSNGSDPDSGASATEWETFVFPNFSAQIKDHIGIKTHEAIAASFSTTTSAAKAAHEITLMSAMKNYFSYGFRTCCGIPNITLLGTELDWVSLRARAEKLGTLMTSEFSDYWMPLLLPVLDEFVNSFRGNVNHGFWQSMVKLRHTGGGSGSYSFISGWMQILFPYLASGSLNTKLKPWREMYFCGPELDDFPPLASSAPVDWEYHGQTFDMDFSAGILGFTQDPTDGALMPLLGWYVSRAQPKSTAQKVEDYKKELKELLLGHKEEESKDVDDLNAPWYERVQYLKQQILMLDDSDLGNQ